MERPGVHTLLEWLLEEGLVGRVDAERVLHEQQQHGGGILYNLLRLKLATAPKLFAFVEEKLGLLYGLAEDSAIDTTLLDLIPPNIAHFYKIVPIRLEQNVLTLAASAVSSSQLLPALEEITGYKVRILLAHPLLVARALERYYAPRVEAGVTDTPSGDRVFVLKDEEKQIRPVNVHLLNDSSSSADWLRTILAEAVIRRSRQVLFRLLEDEVQVFFVKEGEPYVEFKLAPSLFQSIATFMDYLTGIGPFDAQVSQEKKAKIKISDRVISVQIVSLPEANGRSVTLELYDEKTFEQLFQALFDARNGEVDYVQKLLQMHKGMVILSVAPPAQKKLILYSLLGEAVKSFPAVFSLEESIYYTVSGVHQISFGSATPKIFSRILETTLRQRPDMLAIDSIRDSAGMELALLSSSRCLVMACCAFPSHRSVLKWLFEAGLRSALKAHLIPAVLQATSVVRLCKYCKKDTTLSEADLARHGLYDFRDSVFYYNTGCPFCRGASPLMEEPLCEVVPVDEGLLAQLDHATSSGRRSLFPALIQKGVALAAAGKADIKDVLAKCAFLE